MTVRSGIGIDTHRFADGRPLILGGVEIAGERGLAGHSDADVLTHAIIDALLGAAGLGDIGEHFPDTDELWRDADSMALLRAVLERVTAAGWVVDHVDATVVLERPKLAPHRDAIRESLASVLGQRQREVHDRGEDGLRRARGGCRGAGGGDPRPALGGAHARAAALGGRGAQLLVLDLALELLQRAPQVSAHGRGGDLLGEPAREARARDAVGQAQRGDRRCGRRWPDAGASARAGRRR